MEQNKTRKILIFILAAAFISGGLYFFNNSNLYKGFIGKQSEESTVPRTLSENRGENRKDPREGRNEKSKSPRVILPCSDIEQIAANYLNSPAIVSQEDFDNLLRDIQASECYRQKEFKETLKKLEEVFQDKTTAKPRSN